MTVGTIVTLTLVIALVFIGARATWNYISGKSGSCDGCSSCKDGTCHGGSCSVADLMVKDMEASANGRGRTRATHKMGA